MTTLVLQPGVGFDEVAEAIERLGWRRDPDPTAPEPILPGEPELATWTRVAREGRLVASFEPAVMLRSLAVSGESAGRWAEELAGALRTLTREDVAELLASADADADAALRGVIAARELGDAALAEPLRRAAEHEDETVAREARAALERLGAGENGAEPARAAEAPEAVAARVRAAEMRGARDLVGALDVDARRQLVRLLLEPGAAERNRLIRDGAGFKAILATALDDPDWEVRASAMLVAGRLGERELEPAIRQVALPGPGGRERLARAASDALRVAREAVLARLAGGADPHGLLGSRHGRAALGEPIDEHDDGTLLLTALATPVPEIVLAPTSLPEGIVQAGEDTFVHEGTQIELVLVPPMQHWLGGEPLADALPNPIRRWKAPHALLVGRWAEPAGPYEDAIERVGDLARRAGLDFTLPTADELEAAIRGPDGRRHPWGNGFERRAQGTPSPWGVEAPVGHGAWTSDRGPAGWPILVGSGVLCSSRREVGAGEPHPFHPVLRVRPG